MQTAITLEIGSERLLELIDPAAQIEQIVTGCSFTEGPVWNAAQQCLFFSDIPADRRYRWSEAEGARVVREPANNCNGMTYDAAGNLYVCEHWTSHLVRERPDGEREIAASHWQGKELNSPNDVIARADGTVYFTDPSYGRMAGIGRERPTQLDFRGLYRLSPDGVLHLEVVDFDQPNGLCLSPDEKTLYANDTSRGEIRRFSVTADGAIDGGEIFASGIGGAQLTDGVVDGMKSDELGNIWVTGPRGIWVLGPDGTHLGVIHVAEHTGNLTWGGPEWRDLFICASTSVYRLATRVRGHREGYMKGWGA